MTRPFANRQADKIEVANFVDRNATPNTFRVDSASLLRATMKLLRESMPEEAYDDLTTAIAHSSVELSDHPEGALSRMLLDARPDPV